MSASVTSARPGVYSAGLASAKSDSFSSISSSSNLELPTIPPAPSTRTVSGPPLGSRPFGSVAALSGSHSSRVVCLPRQCILRRLTRRVPAWARRLRGHAHQGRGGLAPRHRHLALALADGHGSSRSSVDLLQARDCLAARRARPAHASLPQILWACGPDKRVAGIASLRPWSGPRAARAFSSAGSTSRLAAAARPAAQAALLQAGRKQQAAPWPGARSSCARRRLRSRPLQARLVEQRTRALMLCPSATARTTPSRTASCPRVRRTRTGHVLVVLHCAPSHGLPGESGKTALSVSSAASSGPHRSSLSRCALYRRWCAQLLTGVFGYMPDVNSNLILYFTSYSFNLASICTLRWLQARHCRARWRAHVYLAGPHRLLRFQLQHAYTA